MSTKKVITEFTYQDMVSNRNYAEEAARLLQWSKQEAELAGRLLGGPVSVDEIEKEDMKSLSPAFGHIGQEVYLYPVVAAFMSGELPDPEYGSLPEGMRLLFPSHGKLYGGNEIVEEIVSLFGREENPEGEESFAYVLVENGRSGARFLAGQAAYRLGMPLLLWNGEQADWQELMLTAVLYDALICVDARNWKGSEELFCRRMEQLADRVTRFLILLENRESAPDLCTGVKSLYRRIPVAVRADREAFLRDYTESSGISIPEKVLRKLENSQYTMKVLEQVLCEFTAQAQLVGEGVLTEAVAGQIVEAYEEQEQSLFGISQLATNRRLEDLCLPAEHHRRLVKVCAMLKARDKVMKEWGFADKYSYGNGISLLFYGAPGTGKTMAAQAIAGELGMPLYRVDLSQLISKYIGETQKNIGKVFEQAGQLKGILLFDEADALFARRNEVNDAQDKYSNAETAYLLQRIEEWDGISILATNLLQNFDEAFRRRITYMLNFPMPDEKVRVRLWQKVFPEQAGVSEDMDAAVLAENFELSGAAIRNAALQGAYLAAVEETDIGMKHILSGIANEYRKLNKNMKPEQKALLQKYEAEEA
ncbi:MAG: ATP-binding protein [Acetatifactor sp.]